MHDLVLRLSEQLRRAPPEHALARRIQKDDGAIAIESDDSLGGRLEEERVSEREPFSFFFHGAAYRDVAGHGDDLEQSPGGRIEHRLSGRLEPRVAAIGTTQPV